MSEENTATQAVQNTTELSADTKPKPQCKIAGRKNCSWRAEELTEALEVFVEPCGWCFSDDKPPEIGMTIVRGRHQYGGGHIHLPAEDVEDKCEATE